MLKFSGWGSVFFAFTFLIQDCAAFAGGQRNIIPPEVGYVAIESHEFHEALNKNLIRKNVIQGLTALAETRAMLFCMYHGFEKWMSYELDFRNTDSFRLGTAFEFVWMSSYEPVTAYPRDKIDSSKKSDRVSLLKNEEYLQAFLENTSERSPQGYVPHIVFTQLTCSKL